MDNCRRGFLRSASTSFVASVTRRLCRACSPLAHADESRVALNLELGAIVLAAPGSGFDAAECNAPFN